MNFSPVTGHPTKHDAFEINGNDTNKIREGGKSFVGYRESKSGGIWNSDGILTAQITSSNEVYVRMYVKFQPGWTEKGISKLLRIQSWDGTGNIFSYFTDGTNSPIVLWDISHSDGFGVRNALAVRGDPRITNYYMTDPLLLNLPRSLTNGDLSLNFDGNIRDLNGDNVDDNSVTLIDRLTGLPILPGTIEMSQVYGSAWNKIELYVKMNSGAAIADGVLKQWINDQLCFQNTEMSWQGNGNAGNRQWNVVAIGGNDFFEEYPASSAVEEWYAIDDIEVHNALPVERQ